MSAQQMAWWLLGMLLSFQGVVMIVAFLAGAFGLTILILLGLKNAALSRILFTIAQITQGGGVLDRRDTGEYELQMATTDEDGNPAIVRDGDVVALDGPEEHWSRLGLRPFGVTYEKSDKSLREYRANDIPDEIPPDHMLDGGDKALLLEERNDQALFTPFVTEPEEGYALSHPKVTSRLRKSAGAEVIFRAEEQVLEEEGGSDRMDTKFKIIGMLGAMALGVMTAGIMWL